jgi:hypothetical protein
MEININIKNIEIFTPAAFILDQDNLFNKMLEIRNTWQLGSELIPYQDFDIWLNEPHYDFSLTPEVAIYWHNAKNKLPDFSFTNIDTKSSVNEETLREIAYSNPMDLEIEYLLRKNGLSAHYKNFILRATVCGEIALSDWESTKEINNFYHKDWWFNIPTYEKTYKGRRPKDQIIRDRGWYWEDKRNIPQLQIAKKTPFKPKWILPISYVETVKKGIKRYKQFLKSRDT